ncbi:MAG: CHAD domain-containing protein [Pseudomonadota bacterium]
MTEQTTLSTESSLPDSLERAHVLTVSASVSEPKTASAVHAERIALHRKATVAQAFVVVSLSCLRQVALNQAGVCSGCSGAVHQMRVGLRRLRAALSLFKGAFHPAEVAELKLELAWLTEQLGPARDYQVLLELHERRHTRSSSANEGQQELAIELTRRRNEALARAREAARSERTRHLIAATAVGLVSHADSTSYEKQRHAEFNQPISSLARNAFERRIRRILQCIDLLPTLSLAQRHALRIRVKKLRYATEFFATLFPHTQRARCRFTARLVALQNVLGQLTDLAVHERLAASMLASEPHGAAQRRMASALGVLTDYEGARTKKLFAKANKEAVRLANTPEFWR